MTLGFKMNRGLPWVLPMLVKSCSGSGSWSAPTHWSSGNCPSGSWTSTSVSTSAAYPLSTCSTWRVHMHMDQAQCWCLLLKCFVWSISFINSRFSWFTTIRKCGVVNTLSIQFWCYTCMNFSVHKLYYKNKLFIEQFALID